MLKNLVKVWANRHAQSDKEAVPFLWRVYENTALDVAIDLDEFTDDVSVGRENGAKGAEIEGLIGNQGNLVNSYLYLPSVKGLSIASRLRPAITLASPVVGSVNGLTMSGEAGVWS